MENRASERLGIASLTCGYWNINGHRSKYLGDKLIDKEFLEVIKECDIIGLGEIQSEGNVDIPGFKCLKQKIREKKLLGPKIAGGLGVFVRDRFAGLVELVPNSCEDSIWIRVKEEEMYVGTYYVSPQYSKSRDINFFNTLNEEISHFGKKGTIIVQGDLNARTGTSQDFLKSGKYYNSFGEEMDGDGAGMADDPDLRNSEDRVINARGKELLDLCKLNKLIVMNGRKTGDPFGKFTCHNWNGSSVVDYFLTSVSFVEYISSFIVGDYIPWLSDHCIIKSKILLVGRYSANVISEDLADMHPGFLWNETSIANYKAKLGSDEARERVRGLIDSSTPSTTDLADKICKLMLENVSAAKVKTKKNIRGQGEDPWFDAECRLAKEDLSSLSKKLSKSPLDGGVRGRVFEAKKSFKKIVLAKKRRHRKKLVDELQNKKQDRNLRDFWKLFRKISPKNQSDPRQPGMTDFRNYFEKLSRSGREQDTPSLSRGNGPLDFPVSVEELTDASKRLKYGKAHGKDIACNEMIVP